MVEGNLKRRRSFETGHRPKYLVIADETPEFEKALYFAARRSVRNHASVLLLTVIQPDAQQEWLDVGDLMQAEAEANALAFLEKAAARVKEIAGETPEYVIRTGVKIDEISALITEDDDISVLVLASGTGSDGPGPLISLLAGKTGLPFSVPVTIVPGHLSDADIAAMS